MSATGETVETGGLGMSEPRTAPQIWAPRPVSVARLPDRLRPSEVEAIVAALLASGPLDSRALRAAVGARRWGPTRFRAALVDAREHGLVRRVDRRRWAAC
jgi:hypothetical protein